MNFEQDDEKFLDQVDYHYNDQTSIETETDASEDITQPKSVGHTMSFKIGEKLDNLDDFKYD